MKKRVLLLIPAYNEENNIRKVIKSYRESGAASYTDLLVVDDGSTDRTASVVREGGFSAISQIYNMGYGAALQTGYKYAVSKDYDYVIQMDADGQHDISNIRTIYEKLTGQDGDESYPDIVIGSRYLKESSSFKMSPLRVTAVRFFRLIIRLVTGKRVTDPTSGLQGLSREAFAYYAGFNHFDIRYPDINMIIQMLLLGYRVEEVPAVMHARTEGEPMHKGIVKVFKYMILMMLGTLNALTRNYGSYRKIKKMESKTHE